jgi:hypothetical protein
MGSIDRLPSGRWRARYRDPEGRQRMQTFDRKGMPNDSCSAMALTSSVASGSIQRFDGSASLNGLSSGGRQQRSSGRRHGAATGRSSRITSCQSSATGRSRQLT